MTVCGHPHKHGRKHMVRRGRRIEVASLVYNLLETGFSLTAAPAALPNLGDSGARQ